jgi:hypothetical protein
VQLPRAGTLDITVAPLTQFALGGRVVDDKGAPLEGTSIALQVDTLVDNMGSRLNRSA